MLNMNVKITCLNGFLLKHLFLTVELMTGLLAKKRRKKKSLKIAGLVGPESLRCLKEMMMRERAYRRVLLFMGGVELV
jgi:hypothetical protein